jgi:azurin
MGHNFVLTTAGDAEKVNSAAMAQGPAKDYLPDMNIEPFKTKVIALSHKLLSGGDSEDVKIETKSLKKGGDYKFFCTFPGHFAMMSGKLIVK